MTKVVGLAGRAGSGKSYAADFLVAKHGFTRVKFADSLKNIYRQWLSDHGFNRVKIEWRVEGNGKEIVDEVFVDKLGEWFTKETVSHCLGTLPIPVTSVMVDSFTDIVVQDIWDNPEICTPRRIMQRIGTEWGRDTQGEDFWVDMWDAKAHGCNRVVSDDVRFPNEAERIRSKGGFIMGIFGRDAAALDHPSERFDFDKEVRIRNTFDGAFTGLIEGSL